ncbi:MAG TPA: hypothetical protein VMM13_02290 [Euzebya sp.]|nr:hypothetical protein [Euzebya sp.]
MAPARGLADVAGISAGSAKCGGGVVAVGLGTCRLAGPVAGPPIAAG